MSKRVGWGTFYTPDIRYAGGWQCLDCNYDFGYPNSVKVVIGFSTDSPKFTGNDKMVGIVIVECPKCFEKFWFHITEDLYECLQELAPNWPKDESGQPL